MPFQRQMYLPDDNGPSPSERPSLRCSRPTPPPACRPGLRSVRSFRGGAPMRTGGTAAEPPLAARGAPGAPGAASPADDPACSAPRGLGAASPDGAAGARIGGTVEPAPLLDGPSVIEALREVAWRIATPIATPVSDAMAAPAIHKRSRR